MQLISKQEAKAQGLLHYYTGKPCKHGHIAERLVSTRHCCACDIARDQRPERKAQNAANNAAWNIANSERAAANKAAYRAANKERTAATAAAWAAANKERTAATAAAWAAANPAARAAMGAQRRAAKLQRTPKWLTKEDKATIKALYEQANFMSRVCGEKFHIDHIIPLQGKTVSGLHCPANLQIITAKENVKKSNKLLDNPFLQ